VEPAARTAAASSQQPAASSQQPAVVKERDKERGEDVNRNQAIRTTQPVSPSYGFSGWMFLTLSGDTTRRRQRKRKGGEEKGGRRERGEKGGRKGGEQIIFWFGMVTLSYFDLMLPVNGIHRVGPTTELPERTAFQHEIQRVEEIKAQKKEGREMRKEENNSMPRSVSAIIA
jgi:hypothetical protein